MPQRNDPKSYVCCNGVGSISLFCTHIYKCLFCVKMLAVTIFLILHLYALVFIWYKLGYTLGLRQQCSLMIIAKTQFVVYVWHQDLQSSVKYSVDPPSIDTWIRIMILLKLPDILYKVIFIQSDKLKFQ